MEEKSLIEKVFQGFRDDKDTIRDKLALLEATKSGEVHILIEMNKKINRIDNRLYRLEKLIEEVKD